MRIALACLLVGLAGCGDDDATSDASLDAADAARDATIDRSVPDAPPPDAHVPDADALVPDASCPEGFSDGVECADVDECEAGTPCGVGECTNLEGTYACTCPAGYVPEGGTCTNFDECATGNPCVVGTCADVEGTFACTCPSGYASAGQGQPCLDVDECALGTDACDENARCENAIGTHECTCNAGYRGDGFSCADIDECREGTDGCSAVASCANTPGSFTCACRSGFTGDGVTCDGPRGHVVLIGHDYYTRTGSIDKLLGNAIFLANTSGTVDVLAYRQYADVSPTGEVATTNAAIEAQATARGRSVALTNLTDYRSLGASLGGKDVLLVYEFEAPGVEAATIGAAWAPELVRFLDRGGVVVVLDYDSPSHAILAGAGLMAVDAAGIEATGDPIEIVAPDDPLVVGLAASYVGPDGSRAWSGTDAPVVARTSAGAPVVLHERWPCFVVASDSYGYTACVERMPVDRLPCEDLSTRASATVGCSTDDCLTAFTLGFSFDFYGAAHTGGNLIANGKLGFPGTTTFGNTCTLESQTIAAWWDDLLPTASNQLRYETIGAAPSRRFVAQWRLGHSTHGIDAPPYDVRAAIEETTGDIMLCYADTAVGRAEDFASSASIGIAGGGAQTVVSCTGSYVRDGFLVRIIHP